MIRLIREVEYALMALKDLDAASGTDPVAVRAICEGHGLPFDATARVLQRLNREGVVRSVQGIRGGYFLIRPLNSLTFLDLLRLLGVATEVTGCLEEGGACQFSGHCNIRSPMHAFNARLQAFYGSLTLADLLRDGAGVSAPGARQPSAVRV